MRTGVRYLAVAAATLLGLALCPHNAAAQTESCGSIHLTCESSTEGEVGIGTEGSGGGEGSTGNGSGSGSGGGECMLWEPCHPAFCSTYPNDASCVQTVSTGGGAGGLPGCVDADLDGNYDVTPCNEPDRPCIGFVNGNPDPDLCGTSGPPAAPEFTPPSPDVAAQQAVNQVAWPEIDAGPSMRGGLDWIMAGHIYSLHLGGYDWTPLDATVSITETIVVSGYVFSETFTATLTATPREVVWDTGHTNSPAILQHSPPMQVSCDNPGSDDNSSRDGQFQDWQTYSGYGGPECEYVWWGRTESAGGEPSTVTAEVFWDLTLVTSWAGDLGSVGEHSETFSTSDLEIDTFSSVGVIRDSETRITHEWSGGD